MSFAIPTQRLYETENLVAFHHSQPAYPLHILLVPKRAIASLAEIEPEHQAFLADLFATTRCLIADFQLEGTGYRLIANGGKFQDIPQLHFHLIAGEPG